MTTALVPTTIVDQPVPLLNGSWTDPVGNSADSTTANSDAELPQTVPDRTPPIQLIAVHTIGESLDTHAKAIKGPFTFDQMGSIKVGKYENGVSGEVDISPNGITAQNVNGDQTFALDGTTGDATFAGTIQAGTVVSGQVVVGDNSVVIDGTTRSIIFYDANGIPVIIIGNA
jgi:hypothetical protein